MRNKNVRVLLLIVLLIALVAGAARLLPQRPATLPEDLQSAPSAAPNPDATDAPAPSASDVPNPDATDAPAPSASDAPTADGEPLGYVLVTAGERAAWMPLLPGEYSYTLEQPVEDGDAHVNVIHFTRDGVYMESSTCDNQDCVHQGTMTLENIKERVLMNYIVCMPNRVSLQLFSTEELLAMAAQQETAP